MRLERHQQVMHRTGLVGHRDDQADAVVAGGGRRRQGLRPTHHGKAGAIGSVVLNGGGGEMQTHVAAGAVAGKGRPGRVGGRRRPTPEVHSSNVAVREAAYRAAVNVPFQGSAADSMKLAMVRLQEKLDGTDCELLLQIHDSVIAECPEKDAEKYATLIKQTMEDVHKLTVKLTVDTSTGKTWGEL